MLRKKLLYFSTIVINITCQKQGQQRQRHFHFSYILGFTGYKIQRVTTPQAETTALTRASHFKTAHPTQTPFLLSGLSCKLTKGLESGLRVPCATRFAPRASAFFPSPIFKAMSPGVYGTPLFHLPQKSPPSVLPVTGTKDSSVIQD